MSRINTIQRKEFRVGDLFNIEPTKGKNQQQLIDGNDVPYIAASKENNGFNRMVSSEGYADWISKGNCLQFVHIGDAAAGHCNYIPVDFIGMSGKSSCAYNDNMNKYIGLFIASVITHTNDGKYSFKDSWTGLKVKDTIIKLPVDGNGNPDREYMENYMKNLEEKCKKELELLKRGRKTEKSKIDTNLWKEFKVGDLFEISSPSPRSQNNYEDGEVPFVASGDVNNGILKYCNPKSGENLDSGNCITVSPVDGSSFYQNDNFLGRGGAGSSIMILRNESLNKYRGLFIAGTIRKCCNFTYNDMGNREKLKNLIVKFPVDSEGNPDRNYMENYIKNIESKCKINFSNLKN